jgi:hypothetical protein
VHRIQPDCRQSTDTFLGGFAMTIVTTYLHNEKSRNSELATLRIWQEQTATSFATVVESWFAMPGNGIAMGLQ